MKILDVFNSLFYCGELNIFWHIWSICMLYEFPVIINLSRKTEVFFSSTPSCLVIGLTSEKGGSIRSQKLHVFGEFFFLLLKCFILGILVIFQFILFKNHAFSIFSSHKDVLPLLIYHFNVYPNFDKLLDIRPDPSYTVRALQTKKNHHSTYSLIY